VSISFENFPDKIHVLWSRCCGWPCYQGHGLLDIKMMTNAFLIIKTCLIISVAVLCAACLGDKPVGLLLALMHALV
jgi:hypothetical protein